MGLDSYARTAAASAFTAYSIRYAGDPLTPILVEDVLTVWFVLLVDGSIVTQAAKPEGGIKASSTPEVWTYPDSPDILLAACYTARMDIVWQDARGGIWPSDHKTGAMVTDGSRLRYSMHGQIHALTVVGRFIYGDAFAGTLLNFVQTRGAAKLWRVAPLPAPRMVEDFPRLIVSTAMEILRLDSAYGPNPTLWPTTAHEIVCVHTYGVCDHAVRCRLGG